MNDETTLPGENRKWPLAEARRWAVHVQGELAGLCERIDIAGSVRRYSGGPVAGKYCHDVDLVLLVKPGKRADLEARVRRSANTRILKSGPQNMTFILHNGLQVDLYFATPAEDTLLGPIPTNYGMRLLAMTGSRQHNIKLAALAKDKGLHFHPYRGLMRPVADTPAGKPDEPFDESKFEVFCCEHEPAIFEALGLPYIKPEDRETDAYFVPQRTINADAIGS